MYKRVTFGVFYRKYPYGKALLPESQCLREKKKDSMEQQEKNKGGRPFGTKERYFNRKVTMYLSDEEYKLLSDFIERGWRDLNYSSATRFLLLHSLRHWEKKGGKKVDLHGRF